MHNIKTNDILVDKIGNEIKVIAVFGDRVWTSTANGIDTIEFITKNGWTKKEEPWVPELGKEYWYIDSCYEAKIKFSQWEDDCIDRARASFLGVFPTEQAALDRRDAIIKFIKGLK